MDWNEFADRWCADWNSHDLERVLSHYSDDVIFTSPIAADLIPETKGWLIGKAALRSYWEEGLRRIPDLHFTIERVFGGIDTVVIQYGNQKGSSVSEVLRFDGDKVVRGDGTYAIGAENPAGIHS